MAVYTTINELISSAKAAEISYRNLHNNVMLNVGDDEIIRFPYLSKVNKYKDYFNDCVIRTQFTEEEKAKYRYKPKLLSNDLYGTPELWFVLMDLNNLYSVIDFNLDNVDVYIPKTFLPLLNEVMILEKIIK